MPRPKLSLLQDQSSTLARLAVVAARLDVHPSTVVRWVSENKFPPPIYLQPGSPARWRVRDVEAFIEKRRASRRPRPKLRGALREVER
jgi:predicted DNA-binding transcriptional regulator AlpA